MIDFHSHVLPAIDDGSRSVAESVSMLHMEAEQGIAHIVATPHFYADRDDPLKFLARRDRAEEKLRRELAQHKDLPELFVGAEVYFFRGMSQWEHLNQLTIRGTSCIMIEMGHSPWQPSVYAELEQIHRRWGLIPVIAHIDRYITPLRTFGIPAALERLPVLVQANAEFFIRRSTASTALRMLRKEQIHLLGSDCHNLKDRKPNLADACKVIDNRLGSAGLKAVRECGQQILNLK